MAGVARLGALVLVLGAASSVGGSLACGSSGSSSGAAPDPDAGVVASALPQVCARGAKSTAKVSTCNGSAALCARTYDKATVPMTHNAMSNADAGWSIPNQTHGIARQLADGIRGMMLDLHYYDVDANENSTFRLDTRTPVDQVYLCHTSCTLGHTRLLDGLCDITKFLDENPGEVFSIIFEKYVDDADIDAVVRAASFGDYVYTHAKGAPWPTLREMIDSNKRLVLYLEKDGGTPPYLHRAYDDEMWDTPYTFAKTSDFTCALGRGSKANPLFLVNHWLENPFADIALARQANTTAVLGGRVAQCTKEAGRAPTFVSVDFYEVGNLFDVVRTTNGL